LSTKRVALLVDTALCYGCYTCEIACKQEHNLPAGPRLIRVTKVGPRRVLGKLTMDFYPVHCMHCAKPACLEACPVDAISKRPDGVVLFHTEKCIGCLACVEACPFGVPQYNSVNNVVQNCDLCIRRIDNGLKPACVHHCPTGALFFGDVGTFEKQRGQRRAELVVADRFVESKVLLGQTSEA